MASELAQKIRSRGHWNVVLRPTGFDTNRIDSLAALERGFDAAHIELRGWDYPHRPKDGPTRHQDFIQGTADWDHKKEIWRLYQSGQFVHLFAMDEDWWAESDWMKGHPPGNVKPGEMFEVISALYTMTELFVFAGRLVEAFNLGPEVSLQYELVGLQGRRLQTLDPRRLPLHEWRKAAEDLTQYGNELTLAVRKLIATAPELAIDQILKVYERFNWEPARQTVIDDQRKLLERRL